MDEVIREFLAESLEGLDGFDQNMVALEGDPRNTALITLIFRTVHTIKGTCGFLGLDRLESLTHHGETLLVRLRDGQLLSNSAVTSALLALGDGMRRILANVAETGAEGDVDTSAIVAKLISLAEVTPEAPTAAAPVPEPVPETGDAIADAARPAESTVRIDVGALDGLMNLVGEMVLTRNQILQLVGTRGDPALTAACQRLNILTTELQGGIVRTRMQPIGSLWNRLPRLVRDVAHATGKRVRLEVSGADTELDRTLLESVRDPLVHLLRNAVDHGIESPDVRTEAGKEAEGVIRLRAWHEGGLVNVEITDDGGGIDPERVLRIARDKGLIPPGDRLSEREVLALLFRPGFTTAGAVTSISGRGVGMDVVKANVERIGGTVEVRSAVGRGTTFRLRIPLTLAIIPVMIVVADGQPYAVPQVNIIEVVRADTGRGLERLGDSHVLRLREEIVPVLDLAGTLGGRTATAAGGDLVIVQVSGHSFGVHVDQVLDTEEIVVKPLDPFLRGLPAYAGVTIRGDGSVCLILDVAGLARTASLTLTAASDTVARPTGATTGTSVLLLGVGDGRRVAIPLATIARVELVAIEAFEYAGDQLVIQHRGGVLPVVALSRWLGLGNLPEVGRVPVVVHAHPGGLVGLVGDRLLDVVDGVAMGAPSRSRPGIAGSVIIRDRVTDVLDVQGLLQDIGLSDEAWRAVA